MKSEQRETRTISRSTLLPRAIEALATRSFPVICSAFASLIVSFLLWADLKKSFWFDELFTLNVARLSPHGIWHALTLGSDGNPPLFYLPVHVLLHVLPAAELAVRLPSTLAFLVASWCLYRLARPYTSVPFAAAAAFLPLTTFFAEYANEGRSYACAVCFGALSLYFWQRLTSDQPHRAASLIGLALSIALALGSHFSATLLVAALGTGEVARIIRRRRIDWPVLFSIALGAISVLIYLPIFHALRTILAGNSFWDSPTLLSVVVDTKFALTPLRYLFLIVVFSIFLQRPAQSTAPVRRPAPPTYELIAWFVLLCAPFEGYIQSKFSGAFTIRYAMVMVLPFSLAVAIACDRLSRGSTTSALALICLSSFLGVRAIRETVAAHRNPYALFEQALGPQLPSSEPLVIGTPLLFLPFHHYAPEPLRSRILYLTAPALALKLSGTNTPDINLIRLSKCAPIPQVPYQAFIDKRQPFLVLLKETDHFTWLGEQLANDSIPLHKIGCASIGCLYQASPR